MAQICCNAFFLLAGHRILFRQRVGNARLGPALGISSIHHVHIYPPTNTLSTLPFKACVTYMKSPEESSMRHSTDSHIFPITHS